MRLLIQTYTASDGTITDSQAGSVGATVSSGVWTGRMVRLSDDEDCNPGWALASVVYRWHVLAEDFHGNTATHGWASMVWTP